MTLSQVSKRYAILGGSRGLGRAFLEHGLNQSVGADYFVAARNSHLLASDISQKLELESCDFSTSKGQQRLLESLNAFKPDTIVYFAGGGPFGAYGSKQWKDHCWAWEVTYACAARVLHWALTAGQGVGQVVFLGSAIAENRGDPYAASYSAAKHALVGLYESLVLEGCSIDLRLFSPGYMDTDLLPPKAAARKQGPLASPQEVATELWVWLHNPQFYQGHWRKDVVDRPR